jgi:hypothetical protein
MGVGAVVTLLPLPKGVVIGLEFMYHGFILLSLHDEDVVVRGVCLLGFVVWDLLWLDWGMYPEGFLHFMMDIFDFFSSTSSLSTYLFV